MANYTENYGLVKPTKAESANVDIINANMEDIDDIMHNTQISLAPAYDQNETYNTGDIVMYEMLMYKCKEDNVTGAWNASKWERTTAGESGGGADLDIYGEASGTAEASFSDGAEASLVECEIGIVPTQDLHGYSKPWAGGAGKNKLNNTATSQTVNLVDYTVNPDGTVKAEGTATGGYAILTLGSITLENGNEYILSGCPQGGSGSTYALFISGSGTFTQKIDFGSTITFTMNETVTTPVSIIVYNGATVDINFEPMIRLASEPSGYEPYSNICPISGNNSITVTVASTSGGSGEDYTVSLGSTYYGGKLDLTTGELEVTWGNIASYAGEALTGEWLSSLDEYSELGTPTTGAQVVYELATPQTYNLTPTQVQTLLGQNYISHDGGGTISLVYIKKDSTIIPNPAGAEIPLTGLEINGEKFKIVPETEDISEMDWTLLDSTTSTGTSTLIPEGTKYLALVVDFSVSASIVAIESIKNIIKTMDITSKSVWNVGYEWCDTAGNHTYVAMSGDATHVQAYSGYNTVTAKVYAVS